MALITDISFTCSYRFPDIDDEREKKQMNMVIMITMLKMNSRVDSALTKGLSNERSTYIPCVVEDVDE